MNDEMATETERACARLTELCGTATAPGMIEDASTMLSETITQHASECARFGDSWPGAQEQISRMRDGLYAMEQEAFRIRSFLGLTN